MSKKLLRQIADKIHKNCRPEKIILFGSNAWGKPSKHSDIDIFLVMDSNLRRDKRADKISELFADRTFPLDVIVYTPHELNKSLKNGNAFISEIINRGKTL